MKRENELIERISKLPVYENDFKILCTDGTTATYTGKILNNKRHGKGIMKWSNGDEYESKWKDGVRYEVGTMTFANGDVYNGECGDDGKTNGIGTMTHKNGDVYKGMMKDGVKHGVGTMTFANGDVYNGEWENSQRHGVGMTTF